MAVSPASGMLADDLGHEMERSAPWSLGLKAREEFLLRTCVLIVSVVIALVGLVGNGLVLWLLGFRIRRNPFSVYILNLAATDTLFLCCHLVLSIAELLTGGHYIFIVHIMVSILGFSFLVALSTELCLLELFPVWYRCQRPQHTSSWVCALLWALSSLVWLAQIVVCFTLNVHDFCYYFSIIEFLLFLLLIPMLGVSSLLLLLRVQCSAPHPQPPRLYLLVLLKVLFFLLCGLPLKICKYSEFFHIDVLPSEFPWLLACVSSSVNFFICLFLGRERHRRGRESLKVILQRALEDRQELQGGTGDTPHTNTQESLF